MKVLHERKVRFNKGESQVDHFFSRIEDPLWKSICAEIADLMGPFSARKIYDSKLGSYCFEDKSIDLYCPSEETAQFISQYSFLILGSLQRYFPTIKILQTKVSRIN